MVVWGRGRSSAGRGGPSSQGGGRGAVMGEIAKQPKQRPGRLGHPDRYMHSDKVLSKDAVRVEFTTWNVTGDKVATPEDIDRVVSKRHADIVCLQMVKMIPKQGHGETIHYKWFCKGPGSAILISNKSGITGDNFEQVTSHICQLDATLINGTKVRVISCYVQPSNDLAAEESWNELTKLLKIIPTDMPFLLAGDFNALLSLKDRLSRMDEESGTINHEGRDSPLAMWAFGGNVFQGYDEPNNNGKRLMSLVKAAHLKIVSTFGHPAMPEGCTTKFHTFEYEGQKSQRSFVMVPCFRHMWTVKTFNNWEVGSGFHHALHGNIFDIEKVETAKWPVNDDRFQKPSSNLYSVELPMVCTWNIQGAMPGKIDAILKEQKLPPIMCIQELFLTADEDIQTDNYNWFISKKPMAKNVGILVSKALEAQSIDFSAISENLCYVDLVLKEKSMRVISLYLPAEDDPHHSETISQMDKLVEDLPTEMLSVLGGSFASIKPNYFKLLKERKASLKKASQNGTDAGTELTKEGDKSALNTAEKIDKENEEKDDPANALLDLDDKTNNSVYIQNLKRNNTPSCVFGFIKRFTDFDKCIIISQIAENENRHSHILFPLHNNCRLSPELYFCWIPFFQHSIVAMRMFEYPRGNSGPSTSLLRGGSLEFPPLITDLNIMERTPSTVFMYTEDNKIDVEQVEVERPSITLSLEDTEKFKDKVISFDDLKRLFQDFVIFLCPTKRGIVRTFIVDVLTMSFHFNNLGSYAVEDNCDDDIVLRLRWNGIILEELSVIKEKIQMSRIRKNLCSKLVNKFVNKLAQFCYIVKAKRSFFNRGGPPLNKDDANLMELRKIVKKEQLPTMDDVWKHIDSFFEKDTEAELIFGPDFTLEDLNAVVKYAQAKQLDYRFYGSEEDQKVLDHVALSIKRTPQQLKAQLLSNPQHFKYYLIPPCSEGCEDFGKYVYKYDRENMAEEFKYHKKIKLPQLEKHEPKKKTKTEDRTPTSLLEGLKAALMKNADNMERTRALNAADALYQVLQGSKITISGGTPGRVGESGQVARGGKQARGRGANRGRGGQQDRSAAYQAAENFGNARNQTVAEPPTQQTSRAKRRARGRGRGGGGSDGSSNPSNLPTQKRVADHIDNKDNKRAKMEFDFPKVNKPKPWELGPLIIVWPIDKTSRLESIHKKVIEKNFPLKIVENQQLGKVAFLVTLPTCDGAEKQFCLSVGGSHKDAASSALIFLKRASTIIKPNPDYLLGEGGVPNFIKYKIPCQANPRSYIILHKHETGPVTPDIAQEILNTFKDSYNEDVFFDKDTFNIHEKQLIIGLAPTLNLQVRRFGECFMDGRIPGITNCYICVSKKKSKAQIYDEVLKMGDLHPKYMITQQNPSLERRARLSPLFDRPNRADLFDGPEPPFKRPEPPFERPEPRFDRPEPPFERPEPPFERPEPRFDRPEPPFERPEPRFDRPEPPFKRPEPPFERPEPPFEHPEPRFDRPEPRFDRPENSQRMGAGKSLSQSLGQGFSQYNQYGGGASRQAPSTQSSVGQTYSQYDYRGRGQSNSGSNLEWSKW